MTAINLSATSVEAILVPKQNQHAIPNPAAVRTVTVADQPSLVNVEKRCSITRMIVVPYTTVVY
jgi:hypothetical protein